MKIRDVAEAAGVSIATVSRVLNHPELVTRETKEKILGIIKQHNYSPNSEPRIRHKKRKQSIAIVIPSLQNYRNVQNGVKTVCVNKKYGVQLCVVGNDDDDFIWNLRSLIAQQIDGVILASELYSAKTSELLHENHIPFVCIGGKRKEGQGDLCYINYYESACLLGKYIIESANRSVALLVSPASSDCKEQLIAGFMNTWLEAERPEGDVHIIESEDTPSGGYQALMQMKDQQLPDMVLAQYDEVAIGVIKAAQDSKMHVPELLHVAGFYDSPFSNMITPELTSVEQPTFRLGVLSARRLFDIMEDEEFFDIETQEIALRGHLKIRKSCGNIRAIYEEFE